MKVCEAQFCLSMMYFEYFSTQTKIYLAKGNIESAEECAKEMYAHINDAENWKTAIARNEP